MKKNKLADLVEATINPKLPTHIYIDCDPIAYMGACAAQKAAYQWFEKDSDVPASEVLLTAKDAKEWIEFFEMTAGDPTTLERRTTEVIKPIKSAYDACDEVVKDYLKTAKKFSRYPEKDLHNVTGYFTASGWVKNKDIGGLENRYQFNRYECKETWTSKAPPLYLKECRAYLMKKYKWMKMSPEGFEADSLVIAKAEQAGENGLVMSIDKDLDQCENTWYINMNPAFVMRKAYFATPLGDLWIETNPKGDEKIKGNGFKWLCFQASVGDPSDGYKGLNGFGQKAAIKLLTPATSKVECIQLLKTSYDKKLAKGYVPKDAKEAGAKPEKGFIKYLSWDGKRRKLDVIQLMQQHFFLAYQERGPKDEFNVKYYLQ